MADPNNWVTQPPSTLAKIQNVSAKPELNGQIVFVVAFNSNNSRYVVVHTVTEEQLSLKPENLYKANMLESLKGQYQLLRNNPKIRQQLGQLYQRVDIKLPASVRPEYLGVFVGMLLVGSIWFIGISKTMMIVSLILVLGVLVAPDIVEGKSLEQVGRDVPQRLTSTVRASLRNTPMVGKFADLPYVVPVLLAGLALWTVKLLITPAAGKASPLAGAGAFESSSTSSPPSPHRKLNIEEYYKMGFDDATQGFEYGANLPNEPPPHIARSASSTPLPPLDDTAFLDYGNPKPSPWTFSTMMSLAYLGRNLYALGQDGTGRWNPSRVIYNVQNQPPYQTAFLALSIYRVAKAFMM